MTLSVRALTDWLNDWKTECEEREAERQRKADARIDCLERIAEERNQIFKEMLAELKKD